MVHLLTLDDRETRLPTDKTLDIGEQTPGMGVPTVTWRPNRDRGEPDTPNA